MNPSEAILPLLGGETGGYQLATLTLPVVFQTCLSPIEHFLETNKPDYIIATGLASNRALISLEKVAINHLSARIPDNNGEQPINQTIIPGAPDGLFTDLPLNQIINHCSDQGVKVEISYTAGTYVCNYLMYRLLHLAKDDRNFQSGFIHLPLVKEMNHQAELTLEQLVYSVNTILNGLFCRPSSLNMQAGTIS
jgi:pyroglutamyl-peptidase